MRLTICFLLLSWIIASSKAQVSSGSWQVLIENAGISAMHMLLTHKNKVVIFDGLSAGPSNISQPSGECTHQQGGEDLQVPLDCTAHSIEFDIALNTVRPLSLRSDTWCSAAALMGDGSLLQFGGGGGGSRAIRLYTPCDHCDWYESAAAKLAVPRRYSTAVALADGASAAIVGGRGAFSYEIVSLSPSLEAESKTVMDLPLLAETNDLSQNNLYPFVHLAPDGSLFIFANTESILLDAATSRVVRRLPRMPGGDARNYPSSGSSVLLPLDAAAGFQNAEVLVCGGAPPESFAQASRSRFVNASSTCGRLRILDPAAEWKMETMPSPRVMGDMVLIPPGDVLIINGAARGTAGLRAAASPSLTPLLYKPSAASRFQSLAPSTRPRLHRSSAALLPDARVLVGGSNPNTRYTFDDRSGSDERSFFPTDLSLEAFLPPYLDRDYAARRPRVTYVSSQSPRRGESLSLRFQLRGHFDRDSLTLVLAAPAVATHAFSMGQRMLRLDTVAVLPVAATQAQVAAGVSGQVPAYDVVTAAPSIFAAAAAPAGYYMLFVVHSGLPSHAVWIRLLP